MSDSVLDEDSEDDYADMELEGEEDEGQGAGSGGRSSSVSDVQRQGIDERSAGLLRGPA